MLKYNGTEVKTLKYNGNTVKRLLYNKTIVFPNNELSPGTPSSIPSSPFPIHIITNVGDSTVAIDANTEYTIIIKGAGYKPAGNGGALNAFGEGGVSRVKFKFSSAKTIYLTRPAGGSGPGVMADGGKGIALSLASGEITVGSTARNSSNLLIVAGGGGNTTGGLPIYAGGVGGGSSGGNGVGGSGTVPTGGTQSSAGSYGIGSATNGSSGNGPYGGAGGKNGAAGAGVGGAGGGGYYGGGGGGGARISSGQRQSGAGGSGYATTSSLIPGVIEASTSKWADKSSTIINELGELSTLTSDNKGNYCWWIRAKGVALTAPPPVVSNIKLTLINTYINDSGRQVGVYHVSWNGVTSNSNILKIRIHNPLQTSSYTELDYTNPSAYVIEGEFVEGNSYNMIIGTFNGLREVTTSKSFIVNYSSLLKG